MVRLSFVQGTLEVRGWTPDLPTVPALRWDDRSACFRAPAIAYAEIFKTLVRAKVPYEDLARAYSELPTCLDTRRRARPYQTEALDAWWRLGGRGVVVLPTGSGKTHLAMMAIEKAKRSAIIVTPTLDLVRQWFDELSRGFDAKVGVIGGGEYSVEALTVTTYDSAHRHLEHLGNRFGTLIFDECHHLPGHAYAHAATSSIAPFRLGLTATPERADGRDAVLEGLLGPVAFRKDIVELAGDYLAEYETVRESVELTDEERSEYDEERAIYTQFLRRHELRMPDGWSRFIMLSARTDEGRRAMRAYRRQRALALGTTSKLSRVSDLLANHYRDRTIVFTDDNRTAYEVSRRFLIPVITHQTRVRERSEILGGLSDGTYTAIVTSHVLNEGVDVPEANVAIVLSGSGSVRAHVQRLGRILRKKGDKTAILYEIVAARTSELGTSERRRAHGAYQGR